MKIERKYKPDFSNRVPLAEWLDNSRESFHDYKDYLHIRKNNLIDYSKHAVELARWISWGDLSHENQEEMAFCIKKSAIFASNYFKLVKSPNDIQDIEINEVDNFNWNGTGILEAGTIHPARWCEAYFSAVISRDQESLNELANFPIELLKQSSTISGPVSYLLIEVFQSYHHRANNFPEKLDTAMSAANKQGDDWALDIAMGYLETFAALNTDAGYDFNETLAKNVLLQEEYHIRNAPKDVIPVESFIPLELLGMACMYHDQGNQVTVDSDSLPKFLIEGTYF